MSRTPFLAFLAVLLIALPGVALAQQPLQVDINRGHLEPLPIAIPDFLDQGRADTHGADIAEVVRADLESSALFRSVDRNAFIEQVTDIDLRPRFQDWRVINADALLAGRVTVQSDGRLLVAFRLWDTRLEDQLLGLQFVTAPENWRRVAHKVADAVYQRLTGETGYFDTRVVYVSEGVGPNGVPTRRLAIMDQDGANPSFLTDRSYMALLPNYSPSAQQITYVSFLDGQATTYLYDLETGRQEALFAPGTRGLARVDAEGQSLSARFSPDGERIVASIQRQGGHDIHVFDLRTRQLSRLTDHPSDDVEPSFSPDGRQIVFSSGRGGGSQLYTMNADGSNVQRVSFGGGRYTAPVWSPRGDLIAFVKQDGAQFALGVVRADGSGQERILYEGYFVDTPAWSPNGRVLLFTRGDRTSQGTQYAIWNVDLAGFNLRPAPIRGAASDPAWSPLID
ncbi:Tol-Pal system beta propeller repeat protein TolB [Hyphobacterium marinum]|uniref:Tol-Pal system protein TolB n=1 Tax=Hyphobacterium marinum TaxID=3116574 RepID=A0ABU7LXX4_9PROT|nr:Tol-Pal system beta propeller repeat protein TolB [Hyphobacterium sp. Y6023]MEE2566407.1 Tol-Pal system beta propeller repeat protein TolB [Hyphobacterium sp. Y6023]